MHLDLGAEVMTEAWKTGAQQNEAVLKWAIKPPTAEQTYNKIDAPDPQVVNDEAKHAVALQIVGTEHKWHELVQCLFTVVPETCESSFRAGVGRCVI